MSLTPEQLELRRTGVAATDVAAVVGVNPYRSILDVWRDKRGESAPWEGNAETRWGERMEPVLRAYYAETHNVRLEQVGTLRHPDEPWMVATPDAAVYEYANPNPSRGLECKQHGWRMGAHYGTPGTDEIPLYELCQCVWNMAVTGLERWDLIVVISGPPVVYTIDRDEEVIDDLRDRCRRFWIDCVQGGAVPEPDGSDAFDEWLRGQWGATNAALIAPDDEAQRDIVRGKVLREELAAHEKELDKLVQRLKLKIGGNEGLSWRDANERDLKITWKHNKPSLRIDHTTMAGDMRADARLAMSAVAQTVDRAMLCLKSAGYDPIGASTRATINAHELLELVTTLSRTLVTIADRTDAKYTTEIPGARPFNWPYSWRANKSKKENDNK